MKNKELDKIFTFKNIKNRLKIFKIPKYIFILPFIKYLL